MTEPLYRDADLIHATGMHVDNVRRLISWKAVSPERGGKGVERRWSLATILKVARLQALMRAGFSLKMAHTLLVLFAPAYLEDHFKLTAAKAKTKIKKTASYSKTRKDDLVVTVVNGTMVWQSTQYKVNAGTFDFTHPDTPGQRGLLGDEGMTFVTRFDFKPWIQNNCPDVDLSSLAWRFDTTFDWGDWKHHEENPVSRLDVNLSLASRIAEHTLIHLALK